MPHRGAQIMRGRVGEGIQFVVRRLEIVIAVLQLPGTFGQFGHALGPFQCHSQAAYDRFHHRTFDGRPRPGGPEQNHREDAFRLPPNQDGKGCGGPQVADHPVQLIEVLGVLLLVIGFEGGIGNEQVAGRRVWEPCSWPQRR